MDVMCYMPPSIRAVGGMVMLAVIRRTEIESGQLRQHSPWLKACGYEEGTVLMGSLTLS